MPVGEFCQQPQPVQDLVESQRTLYGKLTQSKSCQAHKEMRGRTGIQDNFNFLKTHIRSKRLRKSSEFKSLALGANASTASAHDISNGSTDMDSMVMSM